MNNLPTREIYRKKDNSYEKVLFSEVGIGDEVYIFNKPISSPISMDYVYRIHAITDEDIDDIKTEFYEDYKKLIFVKENKAKDKYKILKGIKDVKEGDSIFVFLSKDHIINPKYISHSKVVEPFHKNHFGIECISIAPIS